MCSDFLAENTSRAANPRDAGHRVDSSATGDTCFTLHRTAQARKSSHSACLGDWRSMLLATGPTAANTQQMASFTASYSTANWSCVATRHIDLLRADWLDTRYWSRRPVRFAGKHVHRPAKFLHRGSCRLERTSTLPPLTAQQSPTVPI